MMGNLGSKFKQTALAFLSMMKRSFLLERQVDVVFPSGDEVETDGYKVKTNKDESNEPFLKGN